MCMLCCISCGLLLYYYREEESEQLDTQFAETFVIPRRFTTQAVVLNQKARDEIISSLTTLMLVHTKRPEPNLVAKYPTLKDKVDGGFVSFCYCEFTIIIIVSISRVHGGES